jgi:hypothetical protein
LPSYNFLKQANVKLVTGLSVVDAENYPTDQEHYFDLASIAKGVTDRVSGSAGTISTLTGAVATTATTNSPTGGALVFDGNGGSEGGKGATLLSTVDANAWEDKTGNWTMALWFRSDAESTGNNQARIISRDLSDGFGLRIQQQNASGAQDLSVFGEPGSYNITESNIVKDVWNHLAVICTATYGNTIASGGTLVADQGYQIVSLGDVTESQWSTLNNDGNEYQAATHAVGDQFKVSGTTTLPGSGASVKEVSKSIQFYLNGVLQSGQTSYIRAIGASPLQLAANVEFAAVGGLFGRDNAGVDGSIADVKLFTRVITEAEALALYNNPGVRQYSLEVGPDLNFSQTFTEETHSVDTLHEEKFFDAGTITKANPANFDFKLPVISEGDFEIVRTKLLDCTTFDLYVSTQQDVFKLENSVLTNGTFDIERSKPLSLSVTGEASKLTKVGANSSYTIPGTIVEDSATRTHLIVEEQTITLGGSDLSDSIYSVKAELQNNIQWTPYQTVNAGLAATNAATAMFPDSFTIKGKTLSGSIGRYLADTTGSDVQTFSTGTSLRIQAGKDLHVSNAYPGIDINMTSCSFTNRASVGEVFTQSYDWRFTDNSADLLSVIKT